MWSVSLRKYFISETPCLHIFLVAVKLFNGVVTLEIQRRQNSVKARALILQMADMMSALLVRSEGILFRLMVLKCSLQQLHFVEDPEMVTEDGQTVAGRIQNLLGDIKKDITDCGHIINKYHQHSTAG